VCNHLLVCELVTLGALNDIVEDEDGAIVGGLEDQDILVFALLVVEDVLDLESHSLARPHLRDLAEPAICAKEFKLALCCRCRELWLGIISDNMLMQGEIRVDGIDIVDCGKLCRMLPLPRIEDARSNRAALCMAYFVMRRKERNGQKGGFFGDLPLIVGWVISDMIAGGVDRSWEEGSFLWKCLN
jgi:hypothetical protein